jgi:orotidine-5'-phosphate decarboxylase
MTDSFAARFAAVRTGPGPLAIGLDPSGALLEAWGVGDSPDGLDRFADIALAAAVGVVGVVKPQSAFFERHGWRGVRTLQRLVGAARQAGLLVVLDVKRGDVGTTNDAYAEAYLGKDAPIAADAITVHPYLGLAAMGSYVERARQAGSCLLVVTRSSNPEGRMIQSARTGRRLVEQASADQVSVEQVSVEEALLAEIGALNAALEPDGIGPVGAVIGPTHLEPRLDLAAARCIFLAPGIGAQGATPADVASVFAACPDRVIPSASRSLLAAGPAGLRTAASALAAEFRSLLPG